MRTLLGLAAAVLIAAPLEAQGWIEPLPDHAGFGVTKLRTAVSVRVSGRIAHIQVEEWFENRGRALGEGDYLYPLPGEAVFSNFSLFQGDRELRGESMDAREARRIYEEIVRRKKDPALIELVGHGLIRARVFPINPGETRRIVLRYAQVLERVGDGMQFWYYAGGRTTRGPSRIEGQSLPRPGTTNTPITFRLVADSGRQFRDPVSPTHEVAVAREEGRLIVTPVDELRGDFALLLPFAREVVGITLATHRPFGEDGFFMLTLAPGTASGTALPRDITTVVDVSGSMSGEKIEQARAALRQLLNSLGPNDRFRLIAFSNRVTAYRDEWTPATSARIRDARNWIDGLVANGGTNIEGALAAAFAGTTPEGRIPIMVFLTDGLPSVGEQNPERLARRAEESRGTTRVFAFGVGYDVNTYLLDRLSDAGRGATSYVRPGEDVEQAVGQLSTKIRHPVLADLRLDDAPVELSEIYPERLPDLFAGEELVVFGRYRIAGREQRGRVAVAGRRDGRTERFTAQVTFPERASQNAYIPRLWAARKIAALSQRLRLNGHDPELENEIRDTALRYGLLSEYTSYLVQEPLDVALRELQDPTVRGRRHVTVLPAEAPTTAHGARAVQAAQLRQEQSRVRSSREADELEEKMLADRYDATTRHVAGRFFVERAGIWTDVTHADSVEVVDIEAFSDAHFALLRNIPELAPYSRAFERVLVAGKAISIRIGTDGASRLTDRRIGQLVRGFRGR